MQRYTKILIFLYSCRNFFRASRFSFLTTDNILNSVVCFFIDACVTIVCQPSWEVLVVILDYVWRKLSKVFHHFHLIKIKVVGSSYQNGQSRRFVVMVLRKLSFLTDGLDNLDDLLSWFWESYLFWQTGLTILKKRTGAMPFLSFPCVGRNVASLSFYRKPDKTLKTWKTQILRILENDKFLENWDFEGPGNRQIVTFLRVQNSVLGGPEIVKKRASNWHFLGGPEIGLGGSRNRQKKGLETDDFWGSNRRSGRLQKKPQKSE